ncbi:MAG: SUMF1/EgtB/PvdO family nonheme iron enzyme [Thermoguttaceae bacterium]|nr:SUMF1/EgtB/PvdO family nonheme iron enzyme [Thermoguttaceae bacterium]
MKFQNTKLSFALIVLLALLSGVTCAQDVTDAPGAFALILDQRPGEVCQPDSGYAMEIAQRAAKRAGAALDVLYVSKEGKICAANALPSDLDKYAVIWAYQGDFGISQSSPLFSAAVKEALKKHLDAGKVLVLSGGAAALIGALGTDENPLDMKTAPLTFGNDRSQAGYRPARVADPIWAGLEMDRGVFWFTNAAYPTFASFSVAGANVTVFASNPGGAANPGCVFTRGNGTAFAIPFQISPVYGEADSHFRHNFESLIYNLLTFSNTAENRDSLFSPAKEFNPLPVDALRDAIADIQSRYPDEYGALRYLDRLDTIVQQINEQNCADNPTTDLRDQFAALQKEALLANPDLDFEEILYIERSASALGLPQNYNSNSILSKTGYNNSIKAFNLKTGQSRLIYKPETDVFVGDVDLHFDANRILFSMPCSTENNRWRLWELALNNADAGAKLVPTIEQSDVDNYDGCYLADDGVAFCSTACFTGVPCIDGSGHVCNLYRKDATGQVRQLTLEQDHDWSPTLMENGRIMYQRWEYSDLPHAFSRILMHANPDGTNQSEFYGSNSYWPGSMFYARPIPGQPSQFVAIVGGHHEQNRIGDLVLFDTSKGRKENSGAVQRIPGRNKPVCRQILDLPISQTYPQFTHPFPITDKVFLVSAKLRPGEGWQICLVDTFDNVVPLISVPQFACFEPIPIRETTRPPVIGNRTNYDRQEADVFIANVYFGEGLKGVPKGTVKALRIYTYQFSYQGMGAEPHSVGLDGPWDPKTVLGIVPVNEDGSVHFTVPAVTPCAIQPLDKDGAAIQLMRSWFTAMPGEGVSCVGCHEEQNSVPPPLASTQASRQAPVRLQPVGPKQGFSFEKQVQPILDKYCVDCHEEKTALTFKRGPVAPALDTSAFINRASRFSQSYYNLRRYVRTPTKESQMDVLKPYEFYAPAQPLMRILADHYSVTLDDEARRTLYTWIDLNCPYYGNWGEIRNYAIPDRVAHQWERRKELRKLYGGISEPLDDDPTLEPSNASPDAPKCLTTVDLGPKQYVQPNVPAVTEIEKTHFPADNSVGNNDLSAKDGDLVLELAPGVTMTCRRVPGTDYYLGICEVTNEQYSAFNPSHDSGVEFADFIHFSPGEAWHALNRPRQPVVRVTRQDAQAFCDWLAKKTGKQVSLPTQEQWTLVAKAGIEDSPVWFGANADYSRLENLSDKSNADINPISWSGRLDTLPAWRIADVRVNDHSRVSAPVGSYLPNPFGFYDMLGNAAEWTASNTDNGKAVVCGGSWYTPLRDAGAKPTRAYFPHQPGFDVGFRVMVNGEAPLPIRATARDVL